MGSFMKKILLFAFLFCSKVILAQPANDDCSNAIVLTPSAGSIPVFTNATTVNATLSQAACSGTANADVWFQFTATATQHTFYMRHAQGGPTNGIIQLLSGSCGSQMSVFCSGFGLSTNYSNTVVVSQTGLTIGAVYFIRIYYGSNLSSAFEIAVASPPANDDCTNAVPLPVAASGVAPVFTEGNQIGATTQAPLTNCNSNSNNELWYSFTATQSIHTLEVLNDPDMTSQLFTGSCNSLTLVPCNFLEQQEGDTLRTYLENLTPGTTYLLKLYSRNFISNRRFFAGIGAPVFIIPNDLCENATMLVPVSGNCTNYEVSFNKALPNGFQDGVCHGINRSLLDIWYKFVATSTRISLQFEEKDGGTNWTKYLNLYEGSCGSLTPLPCGANPVDYGQLTIGNTYYIRLAKSGGFLTDSLGTLCIGIPSAQSNDECDNALEIPVQTAGLCDYKIYDNLQSSFSYITSAALTSFAPTPQNDVYFKFTATSLKTIVGVSPANSQSIGYTYFEGNCATPVRTFDITDYSNNLKTVIDTKVGETYYLRVGSAKSGFFDICVSEAKPPANNECSSAQVVLTGDRLQTAAPYRIVFEQATLSRPACLGSPTADVWFTFTAPSDSVGIAVSNSTSSFICEIFSGDCGSLVQVRCSTILATNSVSGNRIISGLQAGTNYYIRLLTGVTSAESERLNPFLHVFNAKKRSNDVCAGAVELAVQNSHGYQLVPSTLAGAVTDLVSCTSTPDVWFTFTANATSHNITIRGSIFPRVSIYTGSCGSLTLLPSACFTSTNLGTETRTITGLTPGTTYYLRVASGDGLAMNREFGIAVTGNAVPPNDDCSTPIALSVCTTNVCAADKYYSTRGATASVAGTVPAGNCSFSGQPADVWFSFTGTGKVVNLELASTNANFLMQVYTGTCGALSFVQCNRNNGLLSLATTNGELYRVRVHAAVAGNTLDFTLKAFQPLEINDNLLVNVNCTGNNLVLNPGFDTLKNSCPTNYVSQPGFGSLSYDLLATTRWKMANYATTDIFASCSDVFSPVNSIFNLCFGYETPRSGGNFAGLFANINNQNYNEYLQGRLAQPLTPGKQYLVQFNVSLADYSMLGVDRLGIYFSGTEVAYPGYGVLPYTPQLESPSGQFFTQKDGWQTISFLYTPAETVEYFVIGNFRHYLQTNTTPAPANNGSNLGGAGNGCGGTQGGAAFAYYFVDDVFISEVNGSGCILPIDDLKWDAAGRQGQGIITWSKKDESDVVSYSIEHSRNGTAFDVVNRQQAVALSSYRFSDHKLTVGKHFYRIRVHYKDGQTEVTSVKAIEIGSPGRIQVYPTLTKGTVMVRGIATPSQVQVMMPQGSILQKLMLNGDGSIDLSRYPAGLYIITIADGNKDQVHFRVIKE
jgi:hypothetical protein